MSVALTGDIGNTPSPYLPDAEPVTDADVVVTESVYGDRLHTHNCSERVGELQAALSAAIEQEVPFSSLFSSKGNAAHAL